MALVIPVMLVSALVRDDLLSGASVSRICQIRTIYLPAFATPEVFSLKLEWGLDQNQFLLLSFSGSRGRRI